jgi:methylenetetrahydrofolate dehydrogenase (NADP+)/methenyltetrahydrofolate cyclohydrolase
MAKLIDGKKIADKIKHHTHKEILGLNQIKNAPDRPNLAIILLGEREDSVLYVDLKEKQAKKVGIDTHLYKCPEGLPEPEVFEMISHLNQDDVIDAILVQLPLPEGYDTDGIIRAIDPAKDADRFHPYNLEPLLKTCDLSGLLPPLFGVVFRMLDEIKFEPAGKQAVVVAKSDIFGQSLSMILSCKGIKSQMVHPDDQELAGKTREADLLVSMVGRPGLITGKMIKQEAVVIDAGISRKEGRTLGDVDFASAEPVASYITPVPGGVGPVTIAMLFRNTLELYKQRKAL